MLQENSIVKVFTVSELLSELDALLRDEFFTVMVKGEILDVRVTPGGHATFYLKENKNCIRAILYKGRFIRYRDVIKEGKEVKVTANLQIYKERGELSLEVNHIEEIGLGEDYVKFIELKKKLEREGLFDTKFKKPIPTLPRKIGVVTSIKGAAIHDFLNVLIRRFRNVHVVVYHSKVQGEEASRELMGGIKFFNEREKVDVIVITRGGGSKEDLNAFNDEALVRTIFESTVPVVSAVGHHVDYTLVDLVADVRAETPTAAAEILTKKEEEIQEKLGKLKRNIQYVVKNRLSNLKIRLKELTNRLERKNPKVELINKNIKLSELSEKIKKIINEKFIRINYKLNILKSKLNIITLYDKLSFYKEKLHLLKMSLENSSPRRILEKGYAICYTEDGKVIRVELQKGTLICKVLDRRFFL